ncbi:unnamed protein product [Cladocopium goreaui]|uniref:Uncharacterized protein n=1 Tax=Cladocopium goreaui TaxID=2562237 RepID=A0A9P1DCH3_9DINO|nr:unnamed protein product [Cladocopium goreaui]
MASLVEILHLAPLALAALLVLSSLYALAKGSRWGACLGLLLSALLAVLHDAVAEGLISGVIAAAMYYKFRRIVEDENNKTLAMARQMKVSLMTEEEEALQATSKKIFLTLSVMGAVSCCCAAASPWLGS